MHEYLRRADPLCIPLLYLPCPDKDFRKGKPAGSGTRLGALEFETQPASDLSESSTKGMN